LSGDGHITAQADLRDAEAIQRMVDHVADEFGTIDVLINNAGIFVEHPIESTTYEEWQRAWAQTLGVNLIGAANVTWCALQHMPKHGTSRIVNIGSRGAFRGEPANPAYGASKAAIVAFGQSIAKALAPMRIGVTTLAPGFVETEMALKLLQGPEGDGIRAQSPFDRVAQPEELAKAVYFLASADSEWASGAVLDFNGASYLRM
jgi:NAD(P)-dependent dehydrogenase (short-subunit alcohol dehydrogenase family)